MNAVVADRFEWRVQRFHYCDLLSRLWITHVYLRDCGLSNEKGQVSLSLADDRGSLIIKYIGEVVHNSFLLLHRLCTNRPLVNDSALFPTGPVSQGKLVLLSVVHFPYSPKTLKAATSRRRQQTYSTPLSSLVKAHT